MVLFAQFQDLTLPVAGAEIHCRVSGDGPPVLLLHGYPQTSAMWAPVASILARRFTVVCSDLRGYGDSSKPPSQPDHSTYSFRAMAADQVQLMRGLGFTTFHLVGHDRGGRTGHRAALDHPDAIRSLAVLDIIPTYTLIESIDHQTAAGYWHWFFLSLPSPTPEILIGHDPDLFFRNSVATWGSGSVDMFGPAQLAEYRRCWNNPEMIRASCEDYRAALTIDCELDAVDLHRRVTCPTLAMWGARGFMARRYDIASTWQRWCTEIETAVVDGGHFFVDEQPTRTAELLGDYLDRCEERRGR
ncbi:alpha/beta fold hydrolase [Rhodococcus opacus]|uniref:alpha/beta fold hydrolase n=1 Tax=Rhodococcus opacus TaxID=37919 RepID=UPI001C44EA7F|nr:alpha/beta hydrolase [Rhodococcus opacus]MBV6760303.1 alpha/beta hydrolase [Rhodococcus opacus]